MAQRSRRVSHAGSLRSSGEPVAVVTSKVTARALVGAQIAGAPAITSAVVACTRYTVVAAALLFPAALVVHGYVVAQTQPARVLGPEFEKKSLLPAKAQCGEVKVMTSDGPIVTPHQGVFISKCRTETLYGPDKTILSQRDVCDPPVFKECS